MIPGITVGRNQHFSNSTSFGYGRPNCSTRMSKFIATDGKTIAMLAHRQTTNTANSTNVYYTTDFGATWTQVPGTPPSSNAFVSGTNNNMPSILYADGNWIIGLGDSRVYYTTNLANNWSTWSVAGAIDTLKSTYATLFYSNGVVQPNYIFVDPANGDERIAGTIGSWGLSAVGGFANNLEDVVVGKLDGVYSWFGLTTTVVHRFTGGSATQMGQRGNKTVPTTNLRSLAYWEEKGLWLMGADNSLLYTSPDTGTEFNWTARTLNSTSDATQIIPIPGVGVIALTSPTGNIPNDNELGEVVFSKDGITWTLLTQFNDSTRSYGFGYMPILFNGAVLIAQAENASSSTPISTANGVNYKSVLIADR